MIIYPKESYDIIGCMMTVHRELGCGFLEKVYQEALEREFVAKGIPYKREASLEIFYKGIPLQQDYIADFVCYDKIIVELKAINKLSDIENKSTSSITRDIEIVKDELVSNDIQKILYSNLTRPELDVSVVRVVIPEMELYTIDPSRAGYRFLKV